MIDIITPQNLLEDLIQGMTRPLSLKRMFAMTRPQKGFFIATFATMIAPIVSVIVFKRIIQAPFLMYVVLISQALFLISFLGYVIAIIASEVRAFSHSEKAVVLPIMRSFNAELDLITHLVQTYELRHLEYAQDRLTLHVQHLRARIAWMVGVIDKVGLLPLAITAYFAYHKILADHQQMLMVGSVDWTWALLAIVVTMYLGATLYTSVHQQLDSLCLVLKHAVQRKKAVPSAAQTNGVGK
jgi:hypothetical protein